MKHNVIHTNEMKPNKLRWYQYRLRTLFLLILFVAIGMSWLTISIHNQRKQKVAAEAIRKSGCGVHTVQTWLGKVLHDNSLLHVTHVNVPKDAEADTLLEHLADLRQIQVLELNGNNITDAVLIHLKEMSQLNTLNLNYTRVTDAGLKHLQGLEQLQYLKIANTNINNDGLMSLKGLNKLIILTIQNTNVTEDGIKNFNEALPNCAILRPGSVGSQNPDATKNESQK